MQLIDAHITAMLKSVRELIEHLPCLGLPRTENGARNDRGKDSIKIWRVNRMSDENKDPYGKLKKQMHLARIIFHIPNFIKLSLRLLKDKRVPFYLKLMVYGAIAYVLSPYDLIPDFLVPFLGYFEDIIIGILCLVGLVKGSPPEVVEGYVKAIDTENKRKYRFFR